MEKELKYRCYQFSLRSIKYLRGKQFDSLGVVLSKQLLRSAVSIGANIVEARNSSSRTEFKRYYEIALKSSNESKYWFCLLRDGFDYADEELNALLKECDELSKILAATVISLKRNKKEQRNP